MAIRVIVFDHDDTLKQSERIKQESFSKIFTHLPGAEPVAKEWVAANLGTPRKEMITGILRALTAGGIAVFPNFDEAVAEYIARYGRATEDAITSAPEVTGAREALELLHRTHRLYINSATPQGAIERIIRAEGWSNYFAGLYGSPPGTKREHLGEIIAKEGVRGSEVAVVGDTRSDAEAAEAHGCHFIAVRGEFNNFKMSPQVLLEDLTVLPAAIAALS